MKHRQSDIDKICLYIKDPFKSKYHLLINKRELKIVIKKLKNLKAYINY